MADTQPRRPSARSRLGPELPNLLYGLGDVPNPDPQTVEIVELLAIKFIEDTARAAAGVAGGARLTAEDVLFAVRKDVRKSSRGEELLIAYDAIQDAKKKFNDPLESIDDTDASAGAPASM